MHITEDHVIIITSPEATTKISISRSPTPSFQQEEKRASLEDILGKLVQKTNQYVAKIETTLQSHSTTIKQNWKLK